MNHGKNGPWYSVQLCRVFWDEHGKWRESDSLNLVDLLLAGKVLDHAHTWIYEQPRPSENGQNAVAPADAAVPEPS